MNDLEKILQDQIKTDGAITVADFMAIALGHEKHGYYMKQDPFGKKGDFTTAPEISQLFGEMIAAYIVQSWLAIGSPKDFHLFELGAGRGTLMDDILRTAKKIAPDFFEALTVFIIDMSPTLIKIQKDKLENYNKVKWIDALPETMSTPFFILSNEFLDALPFRQFEAKEGTWFERFIDFNEETNSFEFILKPINDSFEIPKPFAHNKFYELNEYAEEIINKIAGYRKENEGGALFIDYGYQTHNGLKDTLQALGRHEYKDPLENIGDYDLTCHVNFSRLLDIMQELGLKGQCVYQRDFLSTLGIVQRAQQLVSKTPTQKDAINKALNRLLSDDEMGTLFKVLMIG